MWLLPLGLVLSLCPLPAPALVFQPWGKALALAPVWSSCCLDEVQ